jgi:cleavage and polyadenylation specificity factor subunit 1
MQPTLAVLHECPSTWAGLLSQRAYTCSISIITFGLSAATKATTIFTIDSLPHDCFALLAPPPPKLDGLLVLSSNAVLFVDDGKVQCALGVNGFAPTTVSQPLQPPQVGVLEDL